MKKSFLFRGDVPGVAWLEEEFMRERLAEEEAMIEMANLKEQSSLYERTPSGQAGKIVEYGNALEWNLSKGDNLRYGIECFDDLRARFCKGFSVLCEEDANWYKSFEQRVYDEFVDAVGVVA